MGWRGRKSGYGEGEKLDWKAGLFKSFARCGPLQSLVDVFTAFGKEIFACPAVENDENQGFLVSTETVPQLMAKAEENLFEGMAEIDVC